MYVCHFHDVPLYKCRFKMVPSSNIMDLGRCPCKVFKRLFMEQIEALALPIRAHHHRTRLHGIRKWQTVFGWGLLENACPGPYMCTSRSPPWWGMGGGGSGESTVCRYSLGLDIIFCVWEPSLMARFVFSSLCFRQTKGRRMILLMSDVYGRKRVHNVM